MSLFADSRYQWRETYFVLFQQKSRPRADDVKRLLGEVGPRLEVHELAADDNGLLESMTVLSHADAAGMDITYIDGDEVKEQLVELKQSWKGNRVSDKQRAHQERALAANARFDIYHFEEITSLPDEEDDGPLDPGTLLLVLNKLARLCHGEALDPQTGELLE
jgi:hypothetical protein